MSDQLKFESMLFGPNRNALRPQEIAAKLQVTERHVYDLIEEGELRAINAAGGGNLTDRRYARVPTEAWEDFLRRRAL